MATSINDRKKMILDHERAQATLLATMVLEKPKPPLWMIFVPVFFLFFVQKMNQYKKGLQDFADNHLLSRHRAMDKAMEYQGKNNALDPALFADLADKIPDRARQQYVQWIMVMVEHYIQLLNTPGDSLPAIIRRSYSTKTNYLLFCNCLNTAEKNYTQALMQDMDGEQEDLKNVVEQINFCVQKLRRQDADIFFPH